MDFTDTAMCFDSVSLDKSLVSSVLNGSKVAMRVSVTGSVMSDSLPSHGW